MVFSLERLLMVFLVGELWIHFLWKVWMTHIGIQVLLDFH